MRLRYALCWAAPWRPVWAFAFEESRSISLRTASAMSSAVERSRPCSCLSEGCNGKTTQGCPCPSLK